MHRRAGRVVCYARVLTYTAVISMPRKLAAIIDEGVEEWSGVECRQGDLEINFWRVMATCSLRVVVENVKCGFFLAHQRAFTSGTSQVNFLVLYLIRRCHESSRPLLSIGFSLPHTSTCRVWLALLCAPFHQGSYSSALFLFVSMLS